MIIRQTCIYIVMGSGILLFAGCASLGNEPQGGAQVESTPESPSKSVAGAYSDIGSDGSIKPHSESSSNISQGHTTGSLILGGPAEIPDMTTGTIKKTGKPGGNRAGSGSGSNSTGSSSGASGADGR